MGSSAFTCPLTSDLHGSRCFVGIPSALGPAQLEVYAIVGHGSDAPVDRASAL